MQRSNPGRMRRPLSAAVVVLLTIALQTHAEAARRVTDASREQPEQQVDAQQRQESTGQRDQSSGSPEQPNEPVKIETAITVFGEAEPLKTDLSLDVRSLPVNASLLQAVEIKRKTWREPAELLRALPGVDFVYYGQGGIPSGPSVRGYTDRNFGQDIAGHLDGIPLNMFGFVASHGALDMTMIFPEVIDRIELIRGPLDARYGDFNRGASVNFLTAGAMAPQASLTAGTFGSWRVTGIYGRPDLGEHRISFYTAVDGQTVGGYADNQGVDHFRTFHKIRIPFGRSDFSISALTFWSEWEAPSYLDIDLLKRDVIDDQDAVNSTDGGNQNTQLVYARYRRDGDTADELSIAGYVRNGNWRRFRSDFLISPTQTQTRQIDDRVTFGYRAEKKFGHALFGRPSMFVVGSTLQHDDAETRQASTLLRDVLRLTDDVPELLTQFGLFAQEQWKPIDRLKLMGGLRYSHVDYDIDDNLRAPGTFVDSYSDAQFSPKVAAAFSVLPSVEIYGNYATGMRSPTPRTEVRNSLDSVGRVEIAETRSYEAGASARVLRRVEVRGSIWRADNSNEIRGIPPGGTQFESLGKSRRKGGELDLRWLVNSLTRVFATFSWVDARLLTPLTPAANRLPDVPGYVHQIGFESGIPVRGADGRLVVAADLAFYGEKNLNTTGTLKSEMYERLTFRTMYERSRYRVWLGGFAYPGSRFGESAFLFGSRVGVRPNPKVSVESGITYLF